MIKKDKKNILMAFKGQKKGLECTDGTSFPNLFYDFEFKLLLQDLLKQTEANSMVFLEKYASKNAWKLRKKSSNPLL